MNATSVAEGKRTAASSRRVVLASFVGTLIEYYDFGIYGFMAVTIAPLFFPNSDPLVSLLSALAVFASSFLFRPLGGIFFGWLGDRSGRKVALVATVVSMGIVSGIVGLLPTYAVVGIIAPIALIVLRMASGFSAGGEIGGAATYVAESVPRNRRNFFGSLVPSGAYFGFAAAAATVGVVVGLTTPAQMAAWGWRIPFLLALPLAVICLIARLKLEESAEFIETATKGEIVKFPLWDVLRKNWVSVLRVIAVAIATNGTTWIGLTYLNIYLINELGFPPRSVYWISAAVIALTAASMPLAGWLADRWSAQTIVVIGLVGYLVFSYPILATMGVATNLAVVATLYLVFMLFNGFLEAGAFPLFPELFPANNRYSGVAFGFNLGAIMAGGTAPYIATMLVAETGDHNSPAFFVMAVALIGLIGVFKLRPRKKQQFAETGVSPRTSSLRNQLVSEMDSDGSGASPA